MASVPTLGYWNIRGLCEPIRYLLKYAGVEFTDKRLEFKNRDTWLKDKPNLGLDFPNLPYYLDGDIKLSQSLTILKYLARKHGLVARDDPTLAQQELVEQQLEDLRMSFFTVVIGEDFEAKKPEFITDSLEPQLDLLIKYLYGKEWLTGQLSYVDFLAYETLDWLRLFSADTFPKYPALTQYLDRFEALPAIAAYQSSEQFKRWPLFGPVVKWGSQ
ncbi:unnamed protein product [Oppiella nova]|uniref:glutathione transferase n=1 Tax=Oppiella nova TaxID=334625 RepID=A0A7R9MQL5_9ACAR|nr:unnamed protein product [Oppiella nova]CAG2181870.1 unnamed protein product [Oppiella nova]